LYRAGVRAIEYTNRGSSALENFAELKKVMTVEAPDLHLGIGTIKSADEARDFIKVGADFIVAPIVNPEVAAVAEQAGLLWMPGCMTPTEIFQAQQHGAKLIKLFPANILGPEFVRSIRVLFRGQPFMPTGGVEIDLDNIREWLQAGVNAVGMGSKLISADIMIDAKYDFLYQETVRALEIVRIVRDEINPFNRNRPI
jgi:2-dehydro-3-deoxyphosphogluconate aldolase/(4S)-4-hydroxy-2-oxoglutarate aldolase